MQSVYTILGTRVSLGEHVYIRTLTKYLNNWEFTSDDLVANFGFKKYGEKEIIIVDASPEQIKFGNGNFIGKFVFKNNNLLHVDLIPVIKDTKS